MSEFTARSTPWRSITVSVVLLGATALLVAWPPSDPRPPATGLDRLLARVERMALVVPPSDSEVAPFFLDRFETTNAEVAEFLRSSGYRPADSSGFLPRFTAGDPSTVAPEFLNHPATGLSAADAEAIAQWRGKRLQTVGEWQVASDEWGQGGAGSATQASRYQFNLYEAGIADTTRVGTFESGRTNPRSIRVAPPVYDLIGNVAEWAEADPSRDPAGTQPLVGGSFLDSTDRALDRSVAEFAQPGERSFAVGMRCVLPDAMTWLHQVLAEFAIADPAARRGAVERLRRIAGPLERLLERARVDEAIVSSIPLPDPIAITDELELLGNGRVLRIQKARGHVELIDVERGVIDSVSEIGSVRDHVVHDAAGRAPHVTMLTTDHASEIDAPVHCLLFDGNRMYGYDSARRELIEELVAFETEAPRRTSDEPPECILSAPLRRCPLFAEPGRRSAQIMEVTVGEKDLECRALGSAGTLNELFKGGGGSFVYGSTRVCSLDVSESPVLADYSAPADWHVVHGFDTRDPRLANAIIVGGFTSGALPERDGDFACVFTENQLMITLRDFTAGKSEFEWTVVTAKDRTLARAVALRDGFIGEFRDAARSMLELRRFDRSARSIEQRELATLGPRDPGVALLADDRLILFDSEGAIRRLDSRLQDTWVTAIGGFSADLSAPALADVDHDGRPDLVAAGAMRSVACIDFETGRILDRMVYEGVDVLALVPLRGGRSATGLAAAVVGQGFVHLQLPSSRESRAARELIDALAAPPSGGDAP